MPSVVIQGNSDTKNLPQSDLQKSVGFFTQTFERSKPEDKELLSLVTDRTAALALQVAEDPSLEDKMGDLQKEQIRKFNSVMRTEEIQHIQNFVTDAIDGLRIRFQRGNLGLDSVLPA